MKKILIPIAYFLLSVLYTLVIIPFVIAYIILYWLWTFKFPDLTFDTPKYFGWSVYSPDSLHRYKTVFHYIWNVGREYLRY